MKSSNLMKGLLIALLGFCVFAGGIAFAKGNKATVVVVSSHSCPMCVEFENRVLNNPEVQKALAKFTLKKVDANSSRINVEVTPTVVIYDRNNKMIKKFVPSLEKSKFIEILKQTDDQINK